MKKKAKKLKPMSPHDARTHAEICSLQSDNHSTSKGWIMLESGQVVLCQQKPGESPVGSVTFTRADFKRLAEWYFKPQARVKQAGGKPARRGREEVCEHGMRVGDFCQACEQWSMG